MSREARPPPAAFGARADRIARSERAASLAPWVVFAAAVTYAALTLWLTRGATFIADELPWFTHAAAGFDPGAILEPYYGHLIATNRLIFATSAELFGPAHLPITVAMVVGSIAAAAALFGLLRARLGPVAAVPPVILLLFLGTAQVGIHPAFMVFAQACAAGLGALWALERRSHRGDLGACALLFASIGSFEIGIAFAVAAGVRIALERDHRRLWVCAAPLLAFAVWWLWARKFDQDAGDLRAVLLAPNYAANSLAATSAALTGLGHDFLAEGSQATVEIGWGRLLAVGLVVGLVLRGRRNGISPLAVGLIAAMVFLWVAGAIASGTLSSFRTPQATRYIYPIAICLIVLIAELFRDVPKRNVLLATTAIATLALPGNLFEMGQRGALTRTDSEAYRTQLGALELGRNRVPPGFDLASGFLVDAPEYLTAVDRFGSPAFDAEEIKGATAEARAGADTLAAKILAPRLLPASASTVVPGSCRSAEPADGQAVAELPPGGAVLQSAAGGRVSLARFGDSFGVDAGSLAPGGSAVLAIPTDPDPTPWRAAIATLAPVEVCALAPTR